MISIGVILSMKTKLKRTTTDVDALKLRDHPVQFDRQILTLVISDGAIELKVLDLIVGR